MAESIREWVVSYAFDIDRSSMQRAEAGTKAAEDRITAGNAAALAKRAAQENTARQERIAAELAAGRDLSKADVEFVEAQEKRRKTAAEDAHKREAEGYKKTNVLRDEQFKLAESNFLKLNGVAQAFSTGLSGALGALPFGSMLLGVQRTAAGLSNLAVQAQRVGASAAHIQRFVYGMRSAGVDEGQANSTLEGFSSVIKSNEPSYRAALDALHIRTTDANGKPLDIEQLLEGFGGYLKTQDYTTASRYAQNYGIGTDALNAFRNGQFAKGVGGYDDRAKTFGFDADKAAEDARKVDKAWLDAETDFKLVKTRLQAEFFLPVLAGFDQLAKKMEENPQAVENIGRAIEGLGVVVAATAIPRLTMLAARLSGITTLVTSTPLLMRLLGLGSAAGGAAAGAILAGGAAAGAEHAPMVDEYGRVVGNWGGASEDQRDAAPSGRQTSSFGTMWDWMKGKLGFGDDRKVKADIASTAESVKKLADRADGLGSGGGGEGGGGSLGGARSVFGWATRAAGGGRGSAPVNFAGFGNAGWEKSGAKKQDVADYIRHVAASNGIDPEIAMRVAMSEGFNTYTGDHGTSFGAFQLHYGGSGIPGMNAGGLGDRFTKETGLDARDPTTWKAQIDYALKTAKREGWSAWHGWRGASRAGMDYSGPVPPLPSASSSAAASGPVVSDRENAAAENRIRAGHGTSEDHATRKRYLAQQNVPAAHADDTPQHPAHGASARILKWFARGSRADDPSDAPLTTNDMRDPSYAAKAKADLEAARAKMEAETAHRHLENAKLIQRALHGTLQPMLHGNAISAEARARRMGHQYNVRHGDYQRSGDTFNIHAKDAKAGMDAAQRLSAHREYADRTRYGQRSVG